VVFHASGLIHDAAVVLDDAPHVTEKFFPAFSPNHYGIPVLGGENYLVNGTNVSATHKEEVLRSLLIIIWQYRQQQKSSTTDLVVVFYTNTYVYKRIQTLNR
jgi:hypothetical protein